MRENARPESWGACESAEAVKAAESMGGQVD